MKGILEVNPEITFTLHYKFQNQLVLIIQIITFNKTIISTHKIWYLKQLKHLQLWLMAFKDNWTILTNLISKEYLKE